MVWWYWYLTLSFGIGLILATREEIRFYRTKMKPESVDYDIEKAIEDGHIQKEVFGDRTILHPLDDEGRLSIEATEFTHYLQHKQKAIYFIITVLYVTVTWPYGAYDYIRYHFSTADE